MANYRNVLNATVHIHWT